MNSGGRIDLASGGIQLIRVVDDGSGIAPEITEQLFQPFVTTKPHGMGVGLSICRTIVEAHGGRVWAENRSDDADRVMGARFEIALPGVGRRP